VNYSFKKCGKEFELTNKNHQGVARAWNVSRQGGIAAGQSNGCSER